MPRTIVVSTDRANDERTHRERVLISLLSAAPGLTVIVTPHLYHVAEDSPVWEPLRAIEGPVILVSWLHPRPAEWLLRRHGVGADGITGYNLGAYGDARDCFAAIQESVGQEEGATEYRELDAPASTRWYPVVEMTRCINCHHCLQFCLFGVHALDETGQVRVAYPDRCKAGCPACSRICPEGAIIFPLYARDEAIAGAPGLLMKPDAAARRMFYQRTGKPCPVCGSVAADRPAQLAQAGLPASGVMSLMNGPRAPMSAGLSLAPLCQECGRPLPQKAETAPEPAAGSAVKDELDALIDGLDSLTRRPR